MADNSPPSRRNVRRQRRQDRRDWRRSRPSLLPRTFAGTAMCAMFFGVGAAVAATAVVAWATWRINVIEESVTRRIDALAAVQADTANTATPGAAASSAVWQISTVSELGNPVLATAHTVSVSDTRAYLLTALDPVSRNTFDAENPITVSAGDITLSAELWSWDDDTELALLVVDTTTTTALRWATTPPAVGDVLAVAGSTTTLKVSDLDGNVVAATADTSPDVRLGAPLVDLGGAPVATVVSVTDSGVRAAANAAACVKLLRCEPA